MRRRINGVIKEYRDDIWYCPQCDLIVDECITGGLADGEAYGYEEGKDYCPDCQSELEYIEDEDLVRSYFEMKEAD